MREIIKLNFWVLLNIEIFLKVHFTVHWDSIKRTAPLMTFFICISFAYRTQNTHISPFQPFSHIAMTIVLIGWLQNLSKYSINFSHAVGYIFAISSRYLYKQRGKFAYRIVVVEKRILLWSVCEKKILISLVIVEKFSNNSRSIFL